MGVHTDMRNHLNSMMNRRMSWKYAKPLAGKSGCVSDLGSWYGSSNRVNRRLKPWEGVVWMYRQCEEREVCMHNIFNTNHFVREFTT